MFGGDFPDDREKELHAVDSYSTPRNMYTFQIT
jgi:hypothetical protein